MEKQGLIESQSDHTFLQNRKYHETYFKTLGSRKAKGDWDNCLNFNPNFTPSIEDEIDKKLQEDERFDYLLRMQKTFNEEFVNHGLIHPHGMTEYDYKSIPEERKSGLEDFKMRTRRENYAYIGAHLELDALLSLFIQKLLKARPKEPVKFAAEYFTLQGTTVEDFSKLLEAEKIKIRNHRNSNWRSGEKFTASEPEFGYKDVNRIKALHLGPVAQPFVLTPDTPPPVEPEIVIPEIPEIKTAPVEKIEVPTPQETCNPEYEDCGEDEFPEWQGEEDVYSFASATQNLYPLPEEFLQ